MIDFKGKDSEGLSEAIAAAGHFVRLHDNQIEASDETAVQAIIDAYTLDQAKASKSLEVTLRAKSLRDKVVAAISAGEMASWSIKMSEAIRYHSTGDASLCPMLAAEALTRGITVAQLADKVDGNAANFSSLEAEIGGTDGKHRDAIKLLETFEGVAHYDYSTGWPAV